MKLQEISEDIAYKLGDQFNTTLQESIKQTLIIYRAKYIRDDIERNGVISDIHFSQTFTVDLEEVNLLTEFQADMDCITAICDNSAELPEYTLLRSVQKIPKPVRLKNASGDSFQFVGTIDGMKRFKYTSLDRYVFIRELPYQDKTIYYTFINERLYILNNLNCSDIMNTLALCNALLRGIFENPRDIYTFCSSTTFIDDNEFPIALDMLMSLKQSIVRGEYPLIPVKDGEQVNIKPDGND